MDVKPEDFRLNDFVHQQKYQEIVKEFLSEKTKSDKPSITILGGQPGSGKTKMRELAEKERPSVIINADDLRVFHPEYKNLKLSDPQNASTLVNIDVSIWTRKLIEQSVKDKRNIIFDFTFGTSNKEMLRDTLKMFRENGYKTQLHILAVPEQFSKLGIYLRNESQIQQSGAGRFVPIEEHGVHYRNIPENIKMAVEESLIDQVSIFSRSIEFVDGEFVNNKVNKVRTFNKTDADFSKTADIFLQLRNKPLNEMLQKYFSFRYYQVASMINHRLKIALKTKDAAKIENIAAYKKQFFSDLKFRHPYFDAAENFLINKTEITIEGIVDLKKQEASVDINSLDSTSKSLFLMLQKQTDKEIAYWKNNNIDIVPYE